MIRPTFALLSLALCVACSRDEAPPAATPAAVEPAAEAPAAPPAAVVTAPGPVAPAPEDPSIRFDKATFAGMFTGGGMTLDLRADGTYVLEAPGGDSHGSWSHEPSSNAVRLDPGSKTEQDRVFRMSSQDTLAGLSADGQPTGEPLRRQAR